MDRALYTEAPPPHDGDTVCTGCGGVLDPVQTLWSPTGMHLDCERRVARTLAQNRMVAAP